MERALIASSTNNRILPRQNQYCAGRFKSKNLESKNSNKLVPVDPSVLALVGRDMLAHCQFVHDGLKGELLLVC